MSMKRGSSPIDGSSTSSTSGSITSAREISSSRRSPPDSTRAGWLRRSASRVVLREHPLGRSLGLRRCGSSR